MASKKRISVDTYCNPPEKLSDQIFYGLVLDEDQKVFADAIWNPDVDIVFCNAKAGSGKTTIATGAANLLVKYGRYSNIIYIMSPYGDRKQGWLPGTITEKSSVYFEAFYQACDICKIKPSTDFYTESMINQKYDTGYITCITDTYLRGSNFDDAVVIIDEAQNYTIPQLKKTLTRVKGNTKVIVIGHEKQCDLDSPDQSGFMSYLKHFEGRERARVCALTVNHRGWVSQWADELEE